MKLDKKRRIENKTNYRKRLVLLKGKSPRLVVRKTNRYIIIQIISSKESKDVVMQSVFTKELMDYGWPKDMQGSLKSLSAAYLGGYLIGKKASSLKERVILDTGLAPNTKGSRIYAVIKGISDSGITINFDENIIPTKERLEGKNMKKDFSSEFNKIKKSIDGYKPKIKTNKQ
jgi:large subunit ribosomal protein L18